MSTLSEDVARLMSQPESGGFWTRAAAFVVRQALEEAVYQALYSRFGVGRETRFTAQMIALREVVDADLAASVAWTWSALSAATHAQGYALPPTVEELNRWMGTVLELRGEREPERAEGIDSGS